MIGKVSSYPRNAYFKFDGKDFNLSSSAFSVDGRKVEEEDDDVCNDSKN